MDRERLRVMLARMETALAETRANLARVEYGLSDSSIRWTSYWGSQQPRRADDRRRPLGSTSVLGPNCSNPESSPKDERDHRHCLYGGGR